MVQELGTDTGIEFGRSHPLEPVRSWIDRNEQIKAVLIHTDYSLEVR